MTTRGPNLPQATIDRILEMADAGRRQVGIAAKLGITKEQVRYQLYKHGFTMKKTPRTGWNRFTPAEDRVILERRMAGVFFYKIAEELGRAKSSVILRNYILAARTDEIDLAA